MINVAALALMGLSLADVAFVLWTQQQLTRGRRGDLAAAAVRLLPSFAAPANLERTLRALAAEFNVELTVRGVSGSPDVPASHSVSGAPGASAIMATRPVALPAELPGGGQVFAYGGLEHLAVPVFKPPWTQLVVSRRPDDVLPALYAAHARALGVLSASFLVMCAAGWLFLRRTVQAPLRRLAGIVQPPANDGTHRGAADDLSHAIIAMVHTLREDKARIAAQLGALEQAQDQLVRAERLAVVGRLAAGVAHEVGNPLAVLHGFVELLQDPALPPADRLAAVQRMSKELERLHRTVRQLLDYSRAPGPHEAHDGDLREALQHTRELLAPQSRLRGLILRMPELAQPAPVCIATDALIQVLLNLVLNAADALAGTGEIALHAALQAHGRAWQVHVEDSGPGIEPAIAARIFEPFFTTKAAGVGTGLGLAVCERIVTSAGGDISVGQSTLGGARFTLTLPATAAAAPPR